MPKLLVYDYKAKKKLQQEAKAKKKQHEAKAKAREEHALARCNANAIPYMRCWGSQCKLKCSGRSQLIKIAKQDIADTANVLDKNTLELVQTYLHMGIHSNTNRVQHIKLKLLEDVLASLSR